MALLDAVKGKVGKAVDKVMECLTQYKEQYTDEEYTELLRDLRQRMSSEPFDQTQQEELQHHIDQISEQVFKSYLPDISRSYKPECASREEESPASRLRLLQLTRWVTDPDQRDIDKLKNVYNTLASTPCRLALILHQTRQGCEVYMAVYSADENDDPSIADALVTRFRQALSGNFPGAEIITRAPGENAKPFRDLSVAGIPIDEGAEKKAVAVVTNIATEKSEKFVAQGIEKLIDATVPTEEKEEYTLILLCQPMSASEIEEERAGISTFYTAISPFATWQRSCTATETVGLMRNITAGKSLNASVVFLSGGLNGSVTGGGNQSLAQSDGSTLTYTNHQVKTILERLDQQMKRLTMCEALGMWRFAAYVLSDSYSVAENVAQLYRSLTQGEESFVEKTAVNLWGDDTDEAETIIQALRQLEHPRFTREAEERQPVYATAFLSGAEVAQALNLPQHSVPGFSVLRCAAFARNAPAGEVLLGNVVHMRSKEPTAVYLKKKGLTGHTFITGSTGSGKSNTVYWLLDQLTRDEDVHFMVIEPAKGEYKDAFGGREGVSVYGTNPRRSPLLRLNPFSFPCKGDNAIHVLEHLDRLVEVFNACWPMYAAMPAVLKDAMERAYKDCGWSLTRSECAGKEPRFPTFGDLLAQLPKVMDGSDYSADTKGDYKGALMTRLKSLTNGINGQIFCAERELSGEELFDGNVIVDLSRVGSSETKALLMGVLMIKLQEHRMAHADGADQELRHITVLEEAHNLLRRTSTEQSQEGSNLQGKAVEMLTNAIAEMRTYGEGFIIADQAPGLLDMAAIRNTNTKIIMRLPDQSDRELVGKAAGLNDEQITELAKLDTGVAAVYQNHWLEPVLCQVEEFKEKRPYSGGSDAAIGQPSPLHEKFIRALLEGENLAKALKDEDVDALRNWMEKQDIPQDTRKRLLSYLHGDAQKVDACELYRLVHGASLLKQLEREGASVRCAFVVDQQLQDQLRISAELAQRVREIICIYAARLVAAEDNMRLSRNLSLLGGVRYGF